MLFTENMVTQCIHAKHALFIMENVWEKHQTHVQQATANCSLVELSVLPSLVVMPDLGL